MTMALSVPLADIMAYRKVGKAFFGLLDVLCSNHTLVIANCDTPTFAFLMTALDSGLKSLDVVISSQCATAVDNMAGFYFKAVQANGSETPSPAAQVPPPRPMPCTAGSQECRAFPLILCGHSVLKLWDGTDLKAWSSGFPVSHALSVKAGCGTILAIEGRADTARCWCRKLQSTCSRGRSCCRRC